MVAGWMTVAALVLAAPAAGTKLEVRQVQLSYGPLGPERPAAEYYPRDEVWVRFLIVGLEADDDRQKSFDIGLTLSNPTGKVVARDQKQYVAGSYFGDQPVPHQTRVELPAHYEPGSYKLVVTVTDRRKDHSTSFERTLQFRERKLAIIAPQFFHDSGEKVPAPCGGVRGQMLYFHMRGIGLDGSHGKLDAGWDVEVLEAAGKKLLYKAPTAVNRLEDPVKAREASCLTFFGNVPLTCAGEFVLRFRLTDHINHGTATFEVPLHVKEP